MQNKNENEVLENDEIDIFELLGRIWQGKKIIAAVTALFLALGVAYALIATPWYKASARISAPFYKNINENKKELLAEADTIINKIQSKHIDALKGQPKESAFVEKIAPAKISGTKSNLKDFFDIEVMGKSNDEAIALINQIVKEEQEIYKSNISLQESRIKNALYNADVKIKTLQNSLKNSEIQISHIQNMQLPKLENRIRQIEEIFMPNKDKEIANLQNTVLPNDKKAYDELINNVIPKLDAEIQSIEKELKNPNLNQNNAIVLKERLNDLRNRYMSATTTTKQKFEHDLHDSEFVKIPNLLKDKENLLVSQTDLQNQIQTKNDDIVKIQNEIDEKKDEISKLENQKEILKASLEKQNLSNVAIKDDIIVTSQSPAKPKKLLIVAIAGFLGLVLGVFAVLVRGEIKKMKQKNLE